MVFGCLVALVSFTVPKVVCDWHTKVGRRLTHVLELVQCDFFLLDGLEIALSEWQFVGPRIGQHVLPQVARHLQLVFQIKGHHFKLFKLMKYA